MPSAADIITYVGVPLAVAGVVPLLWNMVKALYIRSKLAGSIPSRFRPYFHLIADPAAGTVTVVARTPVLSLPGLWQDHDLTVPPAIELTWSWRWQRAIYKLCYGYRHKTELPHSEKPSQRLPDRPRHLLHRHWMDIVQSHGLELETSSIDRASQRVLTLQSKRFTVDIDFAVQDQVLPLQTTWSQFVWFALGSGCAPYDPNLVEPNTERKYVRYAPLTASSRSGDKLHGFSLARALAWDHISLVYNNTGESPTACRSIGQKRVVRLRGCNMNAPADGNSCDIPSDVARDWTTCLSMPGLEKSASRPVQPLEAALRWWFYDQDALTTPELQVPVTDRIQMARQQSVCRLKNLDAAGLLEIRIVALLKATVPHEHEKATSTAQTAGLVSPSSAGSSELRSSDLEIAASPTTAMTANASDTEDTPQCNAPKFLTKPLEVRQNGAVQTVDKRVSAILSRIRTDITASAFASESYELIGLLAVMHHKLGEIFTRSQKRSIGVGPGELHVRHVSDIDLWQRLLGEFKASALAVRSTDDRIRASTRGLDVRAARARDLPMLDCLHGLRTELEHFFAPELTPPYKRPVLDLADEDADHTFLGHILLCCSDWEKCARQAWPLRHNLAKLIDEVIKALEVWKVHQKYKKEQLIQEHERLIELLRAATRVAEEGIYVAPESGLRELLRAYDGDVYLL